MLDTKILLTNLGIEQLIPMQEKMGKAAIQQGGVVLLSPTGSGKTLAYLLPLVSLVNPANDALQAAVVLPTRELAQQSEDVLKRMKTGLRSMALYGGRPAMDEHRIMRELKPQIVFATPGRLLDHLGKENLSPYAVKSLVIDEFDKCLELGFQEEMESLLKYFTKATHCWLTSATDAEAIPAFMQKIAPNFKTLNYLDGDNDTKLRIEVQQVLSPQKDKLETLGRLLTTLKGQPAIVFVGYRESAERVGKWLRQNGFFAEVYHGGMEQDWRERALYKFRNGSANVLVSTDLAARGLDIPEVKVVIHYHLPLKEEDYTHRNGRTARWDAQGAIYLLLGPEEHCPEYAGSLSTLRVDDVALLKPLPPVFTTLYIGRGKREKLSKGDVLGFLCKKGGLKNDEIGRIDISAHHAYVAVARKKVKALLRQVSGEKIKGMKTLVEEIRG